MATEMRNDDPAICARFHIAYGEFSLAADLTLPGRGVTALFGHSGSGKTTLLRAIAGLERHPGAYLEVNGEVWQDGERFRRSRPMKRQNPQYGQNHPRTPLQTHEPPHHLPSRV